MKTFLIVIFLCPLISLVVEVDSETYLNKFAVHIEGGINVANRVARDCGFTNIGQVRNTPPPKGLDKKRTPIRDLKFHSEGIQQCSIGPVKNFFFA